jgi:hypothetical protein
MIYLRLCAIVNKVSTSNEDPRRISKKRINSSSVCCSAHSEILAGIETDTLCIWLMIPYFYVTGKSLVTHKHQ